MTNLTSFPVFLQPVFEKFLTCELTTLNRRGMPVTWPVLPLFWPGANKMAVLTSIGLAQKAHNARRNPRVSLLYSDPTGSGLEKPPAVLVQGRAEVLDDLFVGNGQVAPELEQAILAQSRMLYERQPQMALYLRNRLTQWLMDWYFMRLLILITPVRIHWWEGGDMGQAPQVWEAGDVA